MRLGKKVHPFIREFISAALVVLMLTATVCPALAADTSRSDIDAINVPADNDRYTLTKDKMDLSQYTIIGTRQYGETEEIPTYVSLEIEPVYDPCFERFGANTPVGLPAGFMDIDTLTYSGPGSTSSSPYIFRDSEKDITVAFYGVTTDNIPMTLSKIDDTTWNFDAGVKAGSFDYAVVSMPLSGTIPDESSMRLVRMEESGEVYDSPFFIDRDAGRLYFATSDFCWIQALSKAAGSFVAALKRPVEVPAAVLGIGAILLISGVTYIIVKDRQGNAANQITTSAASAGNQRESAAAPVVVHQHFIINNYYQPLSGNGRAFTGTRGPSAFFAHQYAQLGNVSVGTDGTLTTDINLARISRLGSGMNQPSRTGNGVPFSPIVISQASESTESNSLGCPEGRTPSYSRASASSSPIISMSAGIGEVSRSASPSISVSTSASEIGMVNSGSTSHISGGGESAGASPSISVSISSERIGTSPSASVSSTDSSPVKSTGIVAPPASQPSKNPLAGFTPMPNGNYLNPSTGEIIPSWKIPYYH
jgi:hypothetical protein